MFSSEILTGRYSISKTIPFVSRLNLAAVELGVSIFLLAVDQRSLSVVSCHVALSVGLFTCVCMYNPRSDIPSPLLYNYNVA